MAVPAMDGNHGASYLTMRGQKHGPRTDDLQRDDRAIYHRRRWERTERSETTSASRTFRIPEPMRSWPMRYKGCHQAHNAQVAICAFFTTRNSLKLHGRRKVFSPIRKVHAISQKLCSHSGTTAVKSP